MKRTRKQHGFTLIEVLLVILILGMLAGVAVVAIGGQQGRAQIDLTNIKIKKVGNALQQYYMNLSHYPTESEGGLNALLQKPAGEEEAYERWSGPYVSKEDLTDAWGQPLMFEPVEAGNSALPPGTQFKVWSKGPDMASETADDIKSWDSK